jgi:MFS superfamily sulfate permease-like transporter
MNIPQALGYARIAGMPVITGVYTLLLPVAAFAAFGSSRYLVVAADSATAAILAGGLAGMAPASSPQYVALAGLVALMTAALLLLARLLKMGFLADFLSQTVLAGFLTGVGIQVGIAALAEVLGVEVYGKRTIAQLISIIQALPRIHPLTLGISTAAVACILLSHRFAPKVPGPLIAVAGAIAASSAFDFVGRGIGVIGPVAGGLPHLALHRVRWHDVQILVPVAASCAVMIITQSAATARVYAARHDQRLDDNADLAGLAAANAAAALTGTFTVNGSPTQTAMVESAGGRSQLAHLALAFAVALVLLFFTGPLQFLPRCVLGAVVFTIAIRLIEWRSLRGIRRESPGEFALAVTTAAIVVLVGVEEGILAAMAMSLLRIVHHSYHPHTAVLVQDAAGIWQLTPIAPGAISEPGLVVYRFSAPLFYANATRFADEVLKLVSPPSSARWVVVDAGAITHVDYSAARVVSELQRDLSRRGIGLVLAHVQSDLKPDLDRHHLTEAIGPSRIFDSLHEALAALRRAGPAN